MKAKEMAFDFLETIFTVACVLYFIFYLFFGNHLGAAKKIFETVGVIAIFAVFFVIRWKLIKDEMKRNEGFVSTDIVAYLSQKDVFFDRLFTCFVSLVVLFIAKVSDTLGSMDFLQAVTILFMTLFFHLSLFSKRGSNVGIIALTELDEVKDRIFLMFLSMFLLIETLFDGGAGAMDFIQIAVMFVMFHYWHRHIFKK